MASNASMSSDEDVPLGQQYQSSPSRNGHVVTNGNGHANDGSDDSEMSEDDDTPLSQVGGSQNHKAGGPSKRKKSQIADSSSSDEDTPLASSPAKPSKKVAKSTAASRAANGKSPLGSEASTNKRKRVSTGKAKAPPKKKLKQEEGEGASEEDDETTSKAPKKTKKKDEHESAPKKGKGRKKAKAKEESDDGEPVYRWWEEQQPGNEGEKWQTLVHNGVIFPPPYQPLPSDVKMKYNGKSVDLPPESEEVAGFYAALMATDHAQDQTFNKNFFEDWKRVLDSHPPHNKIKITTFEHCDFRPMYEYFEAEKAKKKALTTAEKKELKKEKDTMEEKYTYCLLDGRKEKVGNFRVEPPGLFRGRGDHPKKGALKLRVHPEDITLNIGHGVPTPIPNMPGQWKCIIHDKTVTWLANWVENINGNHKYVFLAAGSSLKGQSDMSKFEKARELKKYVDRIRQDYNADLRSKTMADRQRATTMYFIDRLALRAGNEKGEDEADTVGCCSLRCEHVTLEAPNFIIFDFLGKDSIRYYNRVAVEYQVFKNIRYFKENKDPGDNLFDRVTTTLLNKHLASYMKGLTAKVFRTYNASITFQEQLDEHTPKDATVQEKLNAYNQANRMVAILCNHQRSAPKTHDQSMEKMRDKVRSLKYERMKLRHVLLAADKKYKKMETYANDESDIDDDWIEQYEESLRAKEIEKAQKKFAKDNEKLKEEGKELLEESTLEGRIEVIQAEYDRLAAERRSRKATLKRDKPLEKIEELIEKLDEKIKTFKLQIDDREAGKEVALGTSKINYLDPRITAAWCKTHDVPVEKVFSNTLCEKFPWALEVDDSWKF